MKHKIVIGDWSDDGHGKNETYLVEIPDEFTREDMLESYTKNKLLFDVDPQNIASRYEDSTISKELLLKLGSAGFKWDLDDDYYFDVDGEDDIAYIHERGMVHLLMFFISHGYEGFTWTEITDDSTVLFGGYAGIDGPHHYGYGMFH